MLAAVSQIYRVGRSKHHRRSQDFVSGCTFFFKKVDDSVLVVARKSSLKVLNKPLNLACPAKISLKIILVLPGGALGVLGVHLQIFPENYA